MMNLAIKENLCMSNWSPMPVIFSLCSAQNCTTELCCFSFMLLKQLNGHLDMCGCTVAVCGPKNHGQIKAVEITTMGWERVCAVLFNQDTKTFLPRGDNVLHVFRIRLENVLLMLFLSEKP